MPLTDDQKRAKLLQYGYDPSLYEYSPDDTDGVNVYKKGTFTASQPNPSSIEGVDDGATSAAFRSAKRSALPTFGGLGAGALASAALAPETGGLSAVLYPLIASLAGGAATSYAQDKLLPQTPTEQQQSQQDITRHPYATLGGEIAPSLLAFRPSFKNLSEAGSALSRFPGRLEPSQQAQLLNIGLNTGMGALQEGIIPAMQGRDVDPKRLALSMAGGALLNEPWLAGTRVLGFHPSQYSDRGATINDMRDKGDMGMPRKPVAGLLPYNRQMPDESTTPNFSLAQTEELLRNAPPNNMVPPENMSGGTPEDALRKYPTRVEVPPSTPNPQEVNTQPSPTTTDSAPTAEPVLPQQYSGIPSMAPSVGDLRQVERRMQRQTVGGNDNIPEVTPEEAARQGLNQVVENSRDEHTPLSEGEQIQDEYDRGIRHQPESPLSDNTPAAVDEVKSVIQEAGDNPHLYKNTAQRWFNAYLANRRGVNLTEQIPLIPRVDPVTGKAETAVGEYDPNTRNAKVSLSGAMADTGLHELGHGFRDDMQQHGNKFEKQLITEGESHFGGKEEPFIEAAGLEATRRQYKKEGLNEEWLKDLKSWLKIKTGRASGEDYVRLFSRKLLYDPHFADTYARSVVNVKPATYLGVQKGLPTEGEHPEIPDTHLYNLGNDIKDENGNVVHPAGSTVSRDTLDKYGVKYQPQSQLADEGRPNLNEEVLKQKYNAQNKGSLRAERAIRKGIENEGDAALNHYMNTDELGEVRSVKNKIDQLYPKDNTKNQPVSKLSAPITAKDIDSALAASKEELTTKAIPHLESTLDSIARTQGREGKYFKQRVTDTLETRDELEGKFYNEGRRITNEIPSSEQEKMLNHFYMERDQHKLIPWVGKYSEQYTQLRDLLSKMADFHIQSKVPIMDYTDPKNPKMRLMQKDETYIPHMPDHEVMRLVRQNPQDPKAKQLAQDFIDYQKKRKGLTTDEAKEVLNNFLARHVDERNNKLYKQNFGATRRQEGIGLPPSWREKSLPRLVDRYTRNYANDVALHNKIETDPIMRAMLGMTRDPWGVKDSDASKMWPDTKEPIHGILGDLNAEYTWKKLNGEYTKSEQAFNAATGIVKALLIGPLSKIKDVSSNIPLLFNYAQAKDLPGLVYNSIANAHKEIQTSLDYGYAKRGLTAFQEPVGSATSFIDKANGWREKINNIQGAEQMEQFSRGMSVAGSRYLIEQRLSDLKNGVTGNSRSNAIKFLREFGISPHDTITPELLDRASVRLAQRIQATYDIRDLPRWMLEPGYLPAVFTMSKWGIAQTNAFVKRVQQDPSALATGLLGAFLGGLVNQEVSEKITKKKLNVPTLKEGEGKIDPTLYRLTALLQYTGYMGFIGDQAKLVEDLLHKNTPQTPVAPGQQFVTQLVDRTANAVSAINDGENAVDVLSQYGIDMAKNNVQAARLALDQFPESQHTPEKNATRDLRVYDMLEGKPYADYTQAGGNNPYFNLASKRFKNATTPQEAHELAPSALNVIRGQTQGNPEMYARKLEGLSSSAPSYKILPPQGRERAMYLQWVRRTQGDAAAQALIARSNQGERMGHIRSQMIP